MYISCWSRSRRENGMNIALGHIREKRDLDFLKKKWINDDKR